MYRGRRASRRSPRPACRGLAPRPACTATGWSSDSGSPAWCEPPPRPRAATPPELVPAPQRRRRGVAARSAAAAEGTNTMVLGGGASSPAFFRSDRICLASATSFRTLGTTSRRATRPAALGRGAHRNLERSLQVPFPHPGVDHPLTARSPRTARSACPPSPVRTATV